MNFPRIIEAGRDQIALKKFAQVKGAILQAQLHAAPIDGRFHFRRAGKGEGHAGPATMFFDRH